MAEKVVEALSLRAELGGLTAELPYLRLRPVRPEESPPAHPAPRMLVVAFRLAEKLGECALSGVVDILPVANPPAFAAGSRSSPADGVNMGTAFTGLRPRSLTEALAGTVLSLADGADWVLHLHSPGEARYVQHVIFAAAGATRARGAAALTLELGGARPCSRMTWRAA